MENSIKKMIKEYDEKIKVEDILLKLVDNRISIMKKERDCQFDKWAIMDLGDVREERHIINARRQAYVQAKSDFDSLLDNI